MRLQLADLAGHAARAAAAATLLAIAPGWAAPVAAGALFLAVFLLVHDVAHGGLGLPRRAGDWLLAIAGAAILTSGHALRRMHLHHHAHEGAPDDLEGATIAMRPLAAAWAAPRLALGLRIAAWHRGRRERRWQLAEHAACAALVAAAAAGPPPLATYVVVAAVAQLAMPLWLGHVTHRLGGRALGLARLAARTGSTVLVSLAYHDLHHARPRVPCQQLLATARGNLPRPLPTVAAPARPGATIVWI